MNRTPTTPIVIPCTSPPTAVPLAPPKKVYAVTKPAPIIIAASKPTV